MSGPSIWHADILHLKIVLQGVLQKTQQVVTLSVLGREFDEKLKSSLTVMKLLFKVNKKAGHVPISEFYNDAGGPALYQGHPALLRSACIVEPSVVGQRCLRATWLSTVRSDC